MYLWLIAVRWSEPKTQETANVQQAIQSQEVIELFSDSETETSEPKESVDLLWKQRAPKRSNKYIPEEPDVKKKMANEGWLKKH